MGFIDTQPVVRFNENKRTYTIASIEKYKVPIMYLPFELREQVCDYDTDYNNYLDSANSNGEDEFKKIMGLDFSKYKITETVELYNDNLIRVTKLLPSGMKITEVHKENYSIETLENSQGAIVAEKIYSDNDKKSRKTVYKKLGPEGNSFVVVRQYEYDSARNISNDLLKYAYSKDEDAFTARTKFLNEYYTYNGKEIDSKLVEYDKEKKRYIYNNPENGKKQYFTDSNRY